MFFKFGVTCLNGTMDMPLFLMPNNRDKEGSLVNQDRLEGRQQIETSSSFYQFGEKFFLISIIQMKHYFVIFKCYDWTH